MADSHENEEGMPNRHSSPRHSNGSSVPPKIQAKSHDQLVVDLANALMKEGLTVTHLALPNHKHPPKLGRHEPDVIAVDGSGLVHIGEAKTDNDIDSSLTEEQFIDFSSRIMIADQRIVPLHVIVPNHLLQKLTIKLTNMSLIKPHIYRWHA